MLILAQLERLEPPPSPVNGVSDLAFTYGVILAVVFAVGIIVAVIVAFLKLKKSVREEVKDFLNTTEGQEILDKRTWVLLKHDDFRRYVEPQMEAKANTAVSAVVQRIDTLAGALDRHTASVDKLVEKIDAQQAAMHDLERRVLEQRAERAERPQ